jgi:hypothetical protein
MLWEPELLSRTNVMQLQEGKGFDCKIQDAVPAPAMKILHSQRPRLRDIWRKINKY